MANKRRIIAEQQQARSGVESKSLEADEKLEERNRRISVR
jgi:hypothetical protein